MGEGRLAVVLVEALGGEGRADQVAGTGVKHASLRLGGRTTPHEEGDVLRLAAVFVSVGQLLAHVAVVLLGEVLEHFVECELGVLLRTIVFVLDFDNTLLAVHLEDKVAD